MSAKFKKILVTTDLSDLSWVALEPALSIARKFGGKVMLLSVVEPSVLATASPVGGVVVGDFGDEVERMRSRAREKLDLKRQELASDVEIEPIVTDSLEPIKEIVDQAEALGADLVVLATHGRTGLAHVFMGSTAEKIVRLCPVPVLTVRAQEPPDLDESEDGETGS